MVQLAPRQTQRFVEVGVGFVYRLGCNEADFFRRACKGARAVSPPILPLPPLSSSLTFYRNLVDAASAGAEYEYNEGDLDDTLDSILGTTEEGEPVPVEPTADDELNSAELEGIKAKVGEDCAKELDAL